MTTSSLQTAGTAEARPSPLRGGWLWATIVVVAGCLVMCRLGFWQLDRLRQREAANALLLARLDAPPLLLSGVGANINPEEADLRRVTVRGTFDFSQEIVLRNQALDEVPGVHLITPLRLTGGDAAVLVDRGWLPYQIADQKSRAAFDAPAGQVEIRGIVRRSQARTSSLTPQDPLPSGPADRADAWLRVDISRIQPQVPYLLLPVFVQQGELNTGNAPPPGTGGALPRPDIQIDLSNGPHLGYAIQWFSFAAILAGGYVLLYRGRTARVDEFEAGESDA